MNFKKDIDEHLYNALVKNGIKIDKNDKKLAIHYFDIRERLIDFDIKFKTLKSKEIYEILSSNILKDDEMLSFNDIVFRLENNQPIDMYLSNSVYNISMDRSDYLLKNWGIYHLHLEKKNSITNSFEKKSDLLLFLKISANWKNILLISIDKHPKSETWYQEKWLKIIDDNWDSELMCYDGGLKVINELPENEVFKETQRKICAVTINNKVVFPYLGCASSGDSIINVRRESDLYNFVRNLQEDTTKDYYKYFVDISKYCRRHGLVFNKNLDFHIIIEYLEPFSWFVLYEKSNKIKFKICTTKEKVGFNL